MPAAGGRTFAGSAPGRKRAVEFQGVGVEQLAEPTGKGVDHLSAVIEGYPNTNPGTTMIDTVDEIARELGLKIYLAARE